MIIIKKLTLTPTLTCTRTHLLHDKTASFQECVVYIFFLGFVCLKKKRVVLFL